MTDKTELEARKEARTKASLRAIGMLHKAAMYRDNGDEFREFGCLTEVLRNFSFAFYDLMDQVDQTDYCVSISKKWIEEFDKVRLANEQR